MSRPTRSRSIGLKTKITGLLVIFFIANLAILSFVVASRLERNMTELLSAQQFSIASYIAADVDDKISQRISSLQADAMEVPEGIGGSGERWREFLKNQVSSLRLFKAGMVFIDKDGLGVADYPSAPGRKGSTFSHLEYFKEVMATGNPAIGQPRIGRFTKEPGVAIAVPVKDASGAILGVLVGFATLSDSTLFGQVENGAFGKSGWIAIDAPQHEMIVTASDRSRALTAMAKPGVNKMIDRFVAGFEGSGIAVNSRGLETLTSAKRIPSTGWLAQIVLPTEEAFAPVVEMKRIVFGVSGALAVLVGALTWLTIRHALRPLGTAAAAINEMVAGAQSLREIPVSSGDEIGGLLRDFNLLLDQRRKMEDTLRHGEEVFRAILLSITESIVLLDPAGTVVAANPTAAQRLGREPAALIGLDLFSLVPAETGSTRRVWFESVLRSGQPVTGEDFRDGRAYSNSFYPVFDGWGAGRGAVEAVVMVATDVTEHRRTQDLLRAERQLAQTTLDSLMEHVCVIDGEGLILAVNQRWNDFALENGGDPARMGVGANYLAVCDQAQGADAEVARAFARGIRGVLTGDGDRFTYDYPCQAPGEPRWFQANVLRGDSGAGVRAVISHLDISVSVLAERELRRASAEATELAVKAAAASRAKSEFLANMSHEIRTPMNAVLGLSRILQRTQLDPGQHDSVAKILASGRSLLGILNDILDFSKVEAGRMELESAEFNLDDVLAELATVMAGSAASKRIELLVAADPAVPRGLVGDSLRLRQVLINLAGNAVKFTDHGEVVVRAVPAGVAVDGRGLVRFTVRDTGVGIPEAMREELFTPFTQVDSSPTRRFGGTGLGLTISRRLVALMGGEMGFDSALGQGSAFWFTVPFERVARDTRALPPQAPSHPLSRLSVLIVDDNDTARDVLCDTVVRMGWRADVVGSGAQAVAAFLRSRYDVGLIDWRMPGMDGIETCQAIRALFDAANQPSLILITAYDGHAEAMRGAAPALIDGAISKPVIASELHDMVLMARNRRSPLADGRWEVAARAVPGVESRPLAGVRLLIVEDNTINQEVARKLMEAAGASVEIAADGLEAVNTLSQRPDAFDLVLMDVQMPVLDGFAATRRIREELGITEVPIVALTAGVLASDRERCSAAGMVDFIAKPFEPEEMIATIVSRLPQARAG